MGRGRCIIRIYIAGPYSGNGSLLDREVNTSRAVRAGIELVRRGHKPFIPHLTHYVEEDYQAQFAYETYLEWDIEWLQFCEGLLRLPGVSEGADREEAIAMSLDIPVYYSIDEVPSGV